MISQRVPILVYHHVYDDYDPSLTGLPEHRATGVIAASEFRRHLDLLADGGWAVVSTTQVVDWLAGAAELPDHAAALHFDNGWLDAVTNVLPILREYEMSATAYVISGSTSAASEGRAAMVQTSTEGAVQKPFITWDQAAELLDAGWEIGAHTATHPKLAELLTEEGEEAVLAEVDASNEAYAEHLGFVPPTSLTPAAREIPAPTPCWHATTGPYAAGASPGPRSGASRTAALRQRPWSARTSTAPSHSTISPVSSERRWRNRQKAAQSCGIQDVLPLLDPRGPEGVGD